MLILVYDDFPKLFKTESYFFEGEITLSEASKLLSIIKANKSPDFKVFFGNTSVFLWLDP